MVAASKKAFTMVELIFVIVIVGILTSIALPRLAATRDDALISKARTTVAALRSAISTERQKRILRGDFSNIDSNWAEVNATEYRLSSDWVRSGDTFTFTAPNGHTCAFSIPQSGVNKNKLIKGTCNVANMSDL